MTQQFAHNETIAHYRRLLADSLDPQQRATVERLLAEELAKDRPRKPDGLDKAPPSGPGPS